MHNSNKFAFFNIYHLIIDSIFLLIAYYIAFKISSQLTNLLEIKAYCWIIVIYIPLWIFIMGINGMYNDTTFTYYDRVAKYVFYSSLFSSIIVGALMYAVKETMVSRIFFFNFFLIVFIVMLIEKYFVLFKIKLPNTRNTKQVIVIGIQPMYDQFDYFVKKTNIKINVAKYIYIDENEVLRNNNKLLDIEAFVEDLKHLVVDEIIFVLPLKYFKEIQDYALIGEEMGITTRVLLDFVYTDFSRVHVASLGTLPMITFHSVSLNILQLFIKRVIDIIGALVGLILSSVFWIFAVVAIKIDSPGPAVFTQNRVGKNGRIFKLYKFRSMYIDAEERKKEMLALNEHKDGLMFKMENDPRITKVGKFIRKTSIDELPQFLNVLKGDMSLVGTRPPTVDEVDQYKGRHHRRLSMKPGITGMWQVSGRSSIKDFDEIVKLDTKYIDEWSIFLDIKIMIKTVLVVVFRSGAY